MREDREAPCPRCAGKTEWFPGQDGSCERQCPHCGWSERVPDSSIEEADPGQKRKLSSKPTVVVWIEKGCVETVQSDGPARVVVCDRDFGEEDSSSEENNSPCVVFEWDPPDEPDEEFREAICCLDARKKER